MLKPPTNPYVSTGLAASQDVESSHFPDAVVDSLMAKAVEAAPAVFTAHAAQDDFPLLKRGSVIPGPSISYDQSKKLILDALGDFDPVLAQKANGIFDAGFDEAARRNFIEDINAPLVENDLRWRLREVEPGKTTIMRSLSGGSEATAFDPPNPNRRAVIQFEYDNTINSTVYMAHELGHALADDYIRDDKGNKLGDNPKHMDELQAYFVQHILYKYLERHSDQAIAEAAQQHFKTTMARSLYDFPVAESALAAQRGVKDVPLENSLGPGWKKYEPAEKVAADIGMLRSGDSGKHLGALAEKNLNDTIDRFHSRPLSLMVASGLVNQLETKDLGERHRIAEFVLGGKGPTGITGVLSEAGIRSQADMDALAISAVKGVAAHVSAPKVEAASAGVTLASSSPLKPNFALS